MANAYYSATTLTRLTLARSAAMNSDSLALVAANGCRSVAFPSISTGVYAFPIERAARIALREIVEGLKEHDLDEVRMVLFGTHAFDVYAAALAAVSA